MDEPLAFDEGALAQVYRDSYSDLCRYLRRLVGSDGSAEDLAQEAGLRLIRAARGSEIREPRAWLFHAAANLARDALRRRTTADAATAVLLHEAPASNPMPDEQAAVEQDLATLAQAIEALPPRARHILLLARVDGLAYKEIARQLGLATKTVENHLGRAIAKLALAVGRRRDLQ